MCYLTTRNPIDQEYPATQPEPEPEQLCGIINRNSGKSVYEGTYGECANELSTMMDHADHDMLPKVENSKPGEFHESLKSYFIRENIEDILQVKN